MATIAPLTSFTAEDLKSVITGHTTQAKIDLSFYSNEDYPEGDIAVFMKRPLSQGSANNLSTLASG